MMKVSNKDKIKTLVNICSIDLFAFEKILQILTEDFAAHRKIKFPYKIIRNKYSLLKQLTC